MQLGVPFKVIQDDESMAPSYCLQVSFTPEMSASYGLSIMLQGAQLQGSPFTVRVRKDETVPSNCRSAFPSALQRCN